MKYVNATHSLAINSGHVVTLTVKAEANCGGAISAGDKAFFTGTYHVSVPASLTVRP